MTNTVRGHQLRRRPVTAVLCALLLVTAAACGRGDQNNAPRSNAGAPANNTPAAGTAATGGDPAALDAEIERLEKEAGKNPGNAETLAELARAYVRRGNAHRAAGRPREAMDDYRRAQRNDPDNEEALKNAADIAPQVEGTPTGEYGEPAPLPISPNVTGAEEKQSPPPTPKKQG